MVTRKKIADSKSEPKPRNGAERARSPQAKDELRQRILHEAILLFADGGYSGFTMRKLAARIGYTPPTIYSYFKNKDELLMVVISDGWETFQAYLPDESDAEPIERLAELGRRYLDFAFENPELYQLMFMHRPEFLFDLRPEKMNPRMEGLRTIERQMGMLARKDGRFGRVEKDRLAALFWSTIHGLVALALTVPLFDEAWARQQFEALVKVVR